jgi:hypothetical protein
MQQQQQAPPKPSPDALLKADVAKAKIESQERIAGARLGGAPAPNSMNPNSMSPSDDAIEPGTLQGARAPQAAA